MAIDFSELGIAVAIVVYSVVFAIGVVRIIRIAIREHCTLAKWDNFVSTAEKVKEVERRPQRRDDRIQNANDQTQRGEVS